MYVNKSIQTNWHFKKNKLISHLPNMEKKLECQVQQQYCTSFFPEILHRSTEKHFFAVYGGVLQPHT